MKNPIDTVWDLANEFMVDPKYVHIDLEKIEIVAESLRSGLQDHPHKLWGFPESIDNLAPDSQFSKTQKLVLYELIANSVNYRYWYGRHDIRSNGASSTKMYELLDEAFKWIENRRSFQTMSVC